MDLDAGWRNSEHRSGGRLRSLRVLRSTPDLATLIGHARRAVHRLHARVRQIGSLVSRLDALRRSRKSGLNIPVVASHDAWLIEAGSQQVRNLLTVEPGEAAGIVVHLDSLEGFARLPIGLRKDHHTVGQRNGSAVRGHALARAVVKGLQLPAKRRTGFYRGVQHVGQRYIDTVSGAAIDLSWNIHTRRRAANDGVLSHSLQRWVLRDRQAGGEPRHAAERAFAPARAMNDLTAARGALLSGYLPRLRRRLKQHHSRRGTDSP